MAGDRTDGRFDWHPGGPGGSLPRYLSRAVELGRRGWGRVHPNPMVGCVLVRNGEVVAEGWHAEFGGPHAEVVALNAAGERARDAEAYISLEPCRHEGKTPPCTRALIEAGVCRVVFGARDPGSSSGGGARELAAAGVEVEGPLLDAARSRRENPGFFHRREDRPWVLLKLAVSLDGKLAAEEGRRTQLSGVEAIEQVHRMRAGFDAILVGTRTALVDDPRLSVRGPVTPRVPPRRILLDAAGTISADARVFREPGGDVSIFTTPRADPTWRNAMEEAGGEVVPVSKTAGGGVALEEVFARLRREGVRTLLCEGGGVLGSALLEAGLVDRLVLVVAPTFIGEAGVPAFPGTGPGPGLEPKDRWVPVGGPRRVGDDLWVELEPPHALEGGD